MKKRLASARGFARATLVLLVWGPGTAGCFSERMAGPGGPTAEELCQGTQPNVVRIRDYAFGPAELRVPRGTRVTWANCDQDTHTSTSDAGAWESGPLGPLAKHERVFEVAGTFSYHCDPHPGMRARIVVE